MHLRLAILIAILLAMRDVASAHGDLHDSIAATSQAIAQAPGDAALFLRRAELHRMHRDLPAAEVDYLQARTLDPAMEVVTFGIAQVRLAQGRKNDALKLLDSFLAKHPAHAAALIVRADVLEKRDDWKKADADLAAAVASSPEPHFATMRAQLLERHGRPEDAARSLDEASRVRGRVPVLEQQALEIEERAKLTDAALRRLDGFIAREPRADIWLARKAQFLEKSGREPEAREAWQRAAAAFEKVPADKRGSKANRKLAAEIESGRTR